MDSPYFLKKEQRRFWFDAAIPPVLEIESGDTVTFESGDVAFALTSKGVSTTETEENFNPVTGPVYVRGAEPGDALKIEILDVHVSRAWSAWFPNFGPLGARIDQLQIMQVPLEDGKAHISQRVSVPIRPMIGCIGVAPKAGRGATLFPYYPWGGNMDLREVERGTVLYLPVQVAGALLAVGDLHAAMGTAEPTWVSLEAAGHATLRVELEKGMNLNFPRLRVGTATLCAGMGETLEQAGQVALNEAFDYLVHECALAPFEAYAFASACVELRLGGPAAPMVLAVVPDINH